MKNKPTRDIFRAATTDPLVRNALVNFDPSLSRMPMATGFRMAARTLVDDVLVQGANQDIFIAPICALYRHSIELALKDLVAVGYQLMSRTDDVPQHHDLVALWRQVRAVILCVDGSAERECRRIDREIAEVADVDPKADAFRYPMRRDGRPSWPADLTLIDVLHLGEVMDALGDRLEAAADMLDLALDAQREWLAVQRESETDATEAHGEAWGPRAGAGGSDILCIDG